MACRYYRLFFCAVAAVLLANPCQAVIKWETRELPLTGSATDARAVAVFKFRNNGPRPVRFSDPRAMRGLTAEFTKRTFEPGESGEIRAVYNLEDHYGDDFAMLWVSTDDPFTPQTTLTVRIKIPPVLSFSSGQLTWRMGSVADQVVEVKSTAHLRSLEIKPLSSNNVVARLEPVIPGLTYRLIVHPVLATVETSAPVDLVGTLDSGAKRHGTIFVSVRP